MDIDHAMEIATEAQEGGFNAPSDLALICLAAEVRRYKHGPLLGLLERSGFVASPASAPHEDETVYFRADGQGNSLQINFAPYGLPGMRAWCFRAYKTVDGELQPLPMGGAVTEHAVREMLRAI